MVNDNFKNVGILGGSFDPPHKGHLSISKQSLKLLKLKKIIWAITKKNPLKKKPLFTLNQRKKMCQKLIKKNSKIVLKSYEEILKSRTSIALVKYLKLHYRYNIFFIIGSDNLINFHKWDNYKKLLKLTNLVVFSRKGFDTKAKKSVIMKHLKQKNIQFVNNLKINISSTELRNKFINGNKKN
tara:strand:- start:71 stop:619 length:549 start_codon:yes stop_codon:yes gene_type:complete